MKPFGGREGHEEEKKHIYLMHEKLVAIGDDYWIENEEGKREFYIDGKAFRLRNTLILKDAQGRDLYKIQERLLKIRDTMDIKRADNGLAATIKKALINILRDTWKVEIPDGPEMEIKGDILDHEIGLMLKGRKSQKFRKNGSTSGTPMEWK